MRQQHLKKWRWLYALCLFLGAAIPLQAYDMSAGDISSSFDKSTGLSLSRSLFMTMTVRMKGCVIVEIPKSELKLGMVVIKRLCICIRFPVMVIRRVMLHGIG